MQNSKNGQLDFPGALTESEINPFIPEFLKWTLPFFDLRQCSLIKMSVLFKNQKQNGSASPDEIAWYKLPHLAQRCKKCLLWSSCRSERCNLKDCISEISIFIFPRKYSLTFHMKHVR